MKNIIVTMAALLILFTGFTVPVYALSDTQSAAIQKLLDDACRISGVPGISTSIINGDETLYISSGYGNRERGLPANENTLYELASVSKAFTGAGILLLEEQGLLSMTDPIEKYLPWFTLKYQGTPVDMQSLTLNHFLHHTSGLTNIKHAQNIPQGSTPDMLRKTVEMLVDAELAFAPGEQYNYGTVNYDVLGLVIEVVSDQSYERFMTEQVFQPLGLSHTYVYKEDAQAIGQLAQGYRTSFFTTTPYDAPDFGGNKPAGYIISSTTDMARWMGIQMGVVQDIPDVFKAIIRNSHQGNMTVLDSNGMYYGAGWMVNADKTIIEHSGGNPNFATKVAIFPNEQIAICLLSNGASTNIGLVMNIKEILDGNLSQTYTMSGTQLLDVALSSATMIACLLAVVFFALGLRTKRKNERQPITKKKIFITVAWLTLAVAMSTLLCWVLPMFIGYDWSTILVWQTYSILTIFISLTLLAASITWFAYARRSSAISRK
ncbi:penicillin-binding protein, beta-lactamase class C [Desulfitobacterium dehalogenans ATCC 51507]|uniref:Penicillin-binding protein, beta-lactamase class C n=1 Tax=Desulfitobacterium dehalogenans (strain ATCC 51507 / DSM 9161 / JW/IU-DC1) TaxID=756499 RepID=I4A5R3_DESDJ|nr:serine hydrolase domain-containing protein [Desulfitobacterium dehalogenans]AFL99297.1 penicillin-binding protein, beta-lactamase class C [Desulfitobacterium dehalogenans ATCC 51507]